MRYLASVVAGLLIVLTVAALYAGPTIYDLRDARDELPDVVGAVNLRVAEIRQYFGSCRCWRGKFYRQLRRELNTHNAFVYTAAKAYAAIDDAGRAENAGDARAYKAAIRKARNLYRLAVRKAERCLDRFYGEFDDQDDLQREVNDLYDAHHDLFDEWLD